MITYYRTNRATHARLVALSEHHHSTMVRALGHVHHNLWVHHLGVSTVIDRYVSLLETTSPIQFRKDK